LVNKKKKIFSIRKIEKMSGERWRKTEERGRNIGRKEEGRRGNLRVERD
jgi:hypothetical protein